MANDIAAVVVRVSGVTCALPSMHVVETMRCLPITPLDDMPPFAGGVATIRGAATPVIDLGAVLGRPGDARTRFVTVRTGERVVALAVDEVVGVERFETHQFTDAPPLLASSDRSLVRSLAMKDNALHLVLDTSRLLHEADADR